MTEYIAGLNIDCPSVCLSDYLCIDAIFLSWFPFLQWQEVSWIPSNALVLKADPWTVVVMRGKFAYLVGHISITVVMHSL